MKRLLLPTALSLPLAFAGYVAFHPGVAHADSTFVSMTPTTMQSTGAYAVDNAHTSISFEIGHMGVSKVHGRFNTFSGTVTTAEDLTKSNVEFTVQTTSVDTAVKARDDHLRTADFFEVEKWPTMTFKSSSIVKAEEGGYVAKGTMTIKGVSKEVSIPFDFFGPIDAGQGKHRIGVVCKPFTIDRTQFGMEPAGEMPSGKRSIDNEVTLRLALEAVK